MKPDLSYANKLILASRWLFATAFIIFAIQHFMYADFVATLVPSFMPWHLFWVYFTAMAFTAAAISFIMDKYVSSAAILFSVMFVLFIVLLHIPGLIAHPAIAISWTRAIQDTAILGTSLMLTANWKLIALGRLIYAVALMILGLQHFAHVAFITAKVPGYFTAPQIWDYAVGLVMIITSVSMIINVYARQAALILGGFLFLFMMLYNVPLLIANVYNPRQWTTAMLDLAVTAGAFISLKQLSATYFVPVINSNYSAN